jgi:hypothetical protein
MAKIQELLKGRDERLDYDALISKHSWIVEMGQDSIISPDSDGLLCGLLMSSVFGWKIRGFYDGKVMVLGKGVSPADCVFLDMEIFRKDVRSIGHHMLLYNSNDVPPNWDNFSNCIQPNNMRKYDGQHTFRLKYPLATIHLLIGIVGAHTALNISESAICPLLFTDGVYQNLFGYPENVMNWLHYLRADEPTSPLKTIFENEKYSVFKLMQAMDEFFRKRDEITIPNQRGDRLRISDTEGTPFNIIHVNDAYAIDADALSRIERFINILSRLTEWEYKRVDWTWSNMQLYRFTKRDFKKRDKRRLNNSSFLAFVRKKPLSWAMTNNQNIEYTLEKPDKI